MTTTVLPAAAINAFGRSALTALLLSSVAAPALAQQTTPAPSSTNTSSQEPTTEQTTGTQAPRPESADVASPASGATAKDNAPLSAQDKIIQQTGLGEIVVTATKRETNLQKTPIAISVANTQALADRHALSLYDLADGSIPSLRVATFEARQSALTVGIRGIVPFDQNQTARDVPIGVYIDGIYLARSQGLNASLLDIDRIEVLRGPQGTLFGRNTEGGAVSIISKAPSGVFGVRGTVGVGNYGTYNGAAHIDFPAFANLAVKLDGIIQHQNATVRNPLAGQYGWNYHNTVGGRASARWTPVEGLTVDLSYDRTKDENTPNYSQLINYNPLGRNVGTYVNPNTGVLGTQLYYNGTACSTSSTTNPCIAPLSPLVVVAGDKRQKVAEIGVPQQPSVDYTQGAAANIKYKVTPNLELRSITGWRKVDTHQWDNSGGAHRTIYQPNALFSRYSLSELFQKQYSQEFQAVGSLPTIDYAVGVYYFHENVEEAAATPNSNRWNSTGTAYTILSENGNGTPQPPYNCGNDATGTPYQGWDRSNWCVQRHSTAKATSYAAFGQATWSPMGTTGLHLTGGLRWTKDKRDGVLDVVNGNPLNVGGKLVYPGPAVLANPFTFRFRNTRVDPMVTAAYDITPDTHVYAKYSTGYRAGGANDRSATFNTFGSEVVKAYEIGAKTDFFDHKARLNLAAYLMNRTGTQIDFDNVDTSPNSPTFNLHTEETRNAAGKSKIKGFEADLTVRPVWNVQLSGSYAYTDVKVPAVPNPFLPGNPLFQVYTVYTPKHAVSGAVDYEVPTAIADGKLRFHLDANYASKQYSFQAESVQTDPSFIVNGRISLADIPLASGSQVTLAAWSRNLFNETHYYRVSAANAAALGWYGNQNPPRTLGLEASFKIAPPAPIAAFVPPPAPPAPVLTVTCADGTVITAPGACPVPAPVAPPPPAPVERGERGE